MCDCKTDLIPAILVLIVAIAGGFLGHMLGYEEGQQSVFKFYKCIRGHELDYSMIQICRDTYL